MQIPTWLEPLLIHGATDVLISGPTQCQVDRGFGLESLEINLGTDLDLRKLAIELALEAGARVDIAKPIADFSIANLRCQVVLPFGVSNQTLISIRQHPEVQVTLDHLVQAQMLTDGQALFLTRAIQSDKTILIAGPTGSGKTTLLSALIHAANCRVVCIEQTPELNPTYPAIGLLEREANQEGAGQIGTAELLSHALRMRPDRIVIGEVRGTEFGSLLLAINNGHSAIATLHSQSLEALPKRLSVLGLVSGFDPMVSSELMQAVDLVIQLQSGSSRKVSAIARLEVQGQQTRMVPLEI